MTDPRIAALAEALRSAGPDYPYLDGGEIARQYAAAILAALDAQPAMLWDDLSYQAGLEDGHNEASIAAADREAEYEAEIARLREALYNCGLAAQSGSQAMSAHRRGGWEKHRYIVETARAALKGGSE